MKLIDNDYVLIQDLLSRPGEPLTSAPYSLSVVKDLMARFARDRLDTTIPLHFHRHPAGTIPEQGASPPIDRNDLKGTPRIALAQPPTPRPNRQ